MSAFFAKNQPFMSKIAPLLKAVVWELCQIFFSSVFSFCKVKGNQIAPNWPWIRKMTMTPQFSDMISSPIFFGVANFVFKFSYWFKFHINIITSFRVMTICLYKGLTRNLEPTIPDKIFGTKWSNAAKLERKRKVWYVFLCVF